MLNQIGETITLGPDYSFLDILLSVVIVWGFVICYRAFLIIKARVNEVEKN